MTDLPDRAALKARARALRAALARRGQVIAHGQALDLVARQMGARDWNTLSARLATSAGPALHPGARVAGRFLGRSFTGRILQALPLPDGKLRLSLRFDRPVDTVRFAGFSNLRHRVTADVDARGRSLRLTSDGMPHLVVTGPARPPRPSRRRKPGGLALQTGGSRAKSAAPGKS